LRRRERILDRLRGHRFDESPVALLHLQEPLGDQGIQGLPDGRAAHAELFDELTFGGSQSPGFNVPWLMRLLT
jgi:hypothetical protein